MSIRIRVPAAANADDVVRKVEDLLNDALGQTVFASRALADTWTAIPGGIDACSRCVLIGVGAAFAPVTLDAADAAGADSATRIDVFAYEILKQSWTRRPALGDAGEVKEQTSSGWHATVLISPWADGLPSVTDSLSRALLSLFSGAAEQTRDTTDALMRIAADEGWQNVRTQTRFRAVRDAEMSYDVVQDPEGHDIVVWQRAPARRYA